MNVPRTHVGVGLTCAIVSVLAACASSGRRPPSEPPPTTAAPARVGTASPQRTNSFVLTAGEMARVVGITNAYEAVETLRPSFLRTRGSTSRLGGSAGASVDGQPMGRRPGQGSQPIGSQSGGRGEDNPGAARSVEDPGILVYLDRQRYGRVETLREIPIATVEEIRFLNAGEANSLFGMGHPHGVIQIISKRGPSPQ
jgi:hypothetical protein